MELEGLKRCRQKLEDSGVVVKSLTTDRHVSIQAWMRDQWPAVAHYYDTWHISKGKSTDLKSVH